MSDANRQGPFRVSREAIRRPNEVPGCGKEMRESGLAQGLDGKSKARPLHNSGKKWLRCARSLFKLITSDDSWQGFLRSSTLLGIAVAEPFCRTSAL